MEITGDKIDHVFEILKTTLREARRTDRLLHIAFKYVDKENYTMPVFCSYEYIDKIQPDYSIELIKTTHGHDANAKIISLNT